uniref:GDT1 family protein n=1 Tax=Haptolina ericina TaxID=156174 RepID=A0A7S3BY10_9EUKA|mmetsp:Transcript_69756/g.155457  ORF Transcript_69756/g.155457 Transcript_69756/m.155457 type:complete len:138 (+) Transcript_69756:3-416(+)
MLREGFSISHAGASEELEEVEGELSKKEEDVPTDEEALVTQAPREPPSNKVLLQAFTLTFVAEWGDRSQIATIALAAVREPFGVTLGASIGHAMCTGLAVVGGKLLASSISERTVLRVGGCLFCIFGVAAVLFGPSD